MRTQGEGSCFQRAITRKDGTSYKAKVWTISYTGIDGKQHQESSGKTSEKEALKVLRDRQAAVARGLSPTQTQNLTYENIRALLLADYRARGNKSLRTTPAGESICGLPPLDTYFAGRRVSTISTDVLRDFVAKRLARGVEKPTVNRSLALLRRMMNLARKEGKIQVVPYFPMQAENPARQGFVEHEQFFRVLQALPPRLCPLIIFLYETGVRLAEAKSILWKQVNLADREIRLEGTQTKNGQPRTAPLTDELAGMLRKMFRNPDEPVFSAVNLRKEWAKAAKAAGCPGLLIHDLRRSAIRDYVRAGTPEKVAMAISGHKTREVFDRYNIVSTDQVHEAVAKRQKQRREVVFDLAEPEVPAVVQ